LYYLFPLSQQVQVLRLVQNTLIIAVVGLVLLLGGDRLAGDRWVVVPIRQGAQAASRVSAGNLDERMAARGTDDPRRAGPFLQRDGRQPAGETPGT